MNVKNLPPLSDFKYRTDLQIRFNDVDVLGHVNNTVYLSFYDTGKAYFFSEIHERIIEWKRVETVIANIDVAYVNPTYFGDHIAVYTRCMSIGDKSFRLQQVIADTNTGEIKSAAETVMVCFDPTALHSMEMPEHWRYALIRSMEGQKSE